MDVSPSQLFEKARERFALQDYFGCILLLDDLIESGRAYADAFNLRGVSYHLVGRTAEALESFDRALELNPRYVEAHVHRGIVLSEQGESEEAQRAFASARASTGDQREGIPGHYAAKLANQHAALGDAYAEAGAMDRAIEQYRTALLLGPTFHDLRYRLARMLLETGRSLDAREELEKVVAARPQSSDARATLGLACYASGDAASAGAVWREFKRDFPDDTRAGAYLALLERRDAQK
jgi:tetratricopeptide (TPR) repeat protein